LEIGFVNACIDIPNNIGDDLWGQVLTTSISCRITPVMTGPTSGSNLAQSVHLLRLFFFDLPSGTQRCGTKHYNLMEIIIFVAVSDF
jgi:hypothetical protein